MLYGIQQNTLVSPLSLIVSIVLFFGVVAIGDISQKFFLRKINYFKYKFELLIKVFNTSMVITTNNFFFFIF